MTADRRRTLGHGPQGPATAATVSAFEPRARMVAAEADLDTGPLQQLQLPDLAELRDRGVLDSHVLED
ncbi:hypothetical protein [Streptomyces sp. NPDC000410]|uniref:hypothetical protein n=1 Tax=Streptomyces sp. NPDC000410 TaxID=3154254 RepID=UPI0033195A92